MENAFTGVPFYATYMDKWSMALQQILCSVNFEWTWGLYLFSFWHFCFLLELSNRTFRNAMDRVCCVREVLIRWGLTQIHRQRQPMTTWRQWRRQRKHKQHNHFHCIQWEMPFRWCYLHLYPLSEYRCWMTCLMTVGLPIGHFSLLAQLLFLFNNRWTQKQQQQLKKAHRKSQRCAETEHYIKNFLWR